MMVKETAAVTVGGSSGVTLLTIVFIGLKLAGVISWPWLWVLAPLWIGAALTIAIVGVVLFTLGMIVLMMWLWELRQTGKRLKKKKEDEE